MSYPFPRRWTCLSSKVPRIHESDDGAMVREESLFQFIALKAGGGALQTKSGKTRFFTDAESAMKALDAEAPKGSREESSRDSHGSKAPENGFDDAFDDENEYALEDAEEASDKYRIAALYVDPKGPYGERCEEIYDAERNAMTYDGPYPVIAHPPCGPWGRLAWNCTDQDPATGFHAVAMVRKYGGILEHPVGSKLFEACGIETGDWDNPERPLDPWGGYTLKLRQWDYGHRGEKETIFYIVGAEALPFLLKRLDDVKECGMPVQNMSPLGRRLTPDLMAAWLCEVAASCVDGATWRKKMFGQESVPTAELTEEQIEARLHSYRAENGSLSGPWWGSIGYCSPAEHQGFYRHIVRGTHDDKRLSREERKARHGTEAVLGWRTAKKKDSVEVWRERILELFSADARERTFNQICVELTDNEYTADILFQGHADKALWDLVAEWKLEHREGSDKALYFRCKITREESAGSAR